MSCGCSGQTVIILDNHTQHTPIQLDEVYHQVAEKQPLWPWDGIIIGVRSIYTTPVWYVPCISQVTMNMHVQHVIAFTT
jgi:hypothetical protein